MKHVFVSRQDVIADGQACEELPNGRKLAQRHLDRIRGCDSDGSVVRGQHFAFPGATSIGLRT